MNLYANEYSRVHFLSRFIKIAKILRNLSATKFSNVL